MYSTKKLSLLALMAIAPIFANGQRVEVTPPQGNDICTFSSMNLNKITGYKEGGANVNADKTCFGHDIVMKDTLYKSGVGVHAASKALIHVNGATRFVANLGIVDEASDRPDHGIVNYVISFYKNKQKMTIKQGVIDRRDKSSVKLDLKLKGYDYLELDLQTGNVNWADQAAWANAYFVYEGAKPKTVTEKELYGKEEEEVIIDLPKVGKDGAEIIPLSSLDISKASCGWGENHKDKSVGNNPLKISGKTFSSGVGTHAPAQMIIKLNGAVTRFFSYIGIDDEVDADASTRKAGIARYRVYLKGEDGNEVLQKEGVIRYNDNEPDSVDVDCNGWKYLFLEVYEHEGGNDSDHADWANAYFEYHEQNSTRPVIVPTELFQSKLACADALFAQPGVRFMHKIRTIDSGTKVHVENLPEGLVWNAKRNLVEGIVKEEGKYQYNVIAETDGERKDEPISLTVSSKLQQPVPFMGWLSWNVVEGNISEEVVKQTADAFINQGLLDAGYNYLCIDDLWHADNREAGTGKPLPDARKFPNGMKVCADYAHSKGLKFGIYSDAADKTCAGRFGSYGYETIDAKQYAEWGVDLLKYDYCGAPSDAQSAEDRYKAMGDALKASGRNILFYMCEWGAREPWKWGANTGATCWRCTYDTRDGWDSKGGGIGVIQSINGMKDIWAYSGPNRFNDADMMCVGIHGTGKSSNAWIEKPGMTQDEYSSQFALWCMWSSPLTLSFDLCKPITAEDLSIITNEELIALDQDRMGQQAELIEENNNFIVFAKDLENGDVAISVTNLSDNAADYTFNFNKIPALDAQTTYQVRDLWKKQHVGECTETYKTHVASHATQVFRLSQNATGIAEATMDNFKVNMKKGQLDIDMPNSNGLSKRVLVSDLSGRVVSSTTSTADHLKLTVNGAKGVHIINVICAGQSKSMKVTL